MAEVSHIASARKAPRIGVDVGELDDMRASLSRLLEGMGQIKEALVAQDKRTDLFWSKDWPDIRSEIDDIKTEVDTLRDTVRDAQQTTRVIRWLVGSLVVLVGLASGFLAIYH